MRLRTGLLFLCLLATPMLTTAIPAAAQPAPPVLRTGSVEIVPDPAMGSFLPIDTATLRTYLCSGVLPGDWIDTISPRGECDLSVTPPPRLGLFVDKIKYVGGSSWRISLHPEGPASWNGSAPVETSCGLWDVSMDLDTEQTQPVSELALEPSAADPAQGVFAGAVKLAVRYRFFNRTLGTTVEVPAMTSLDLAGHWATAPEGGPSPGAGAASASNVVLFAGLFDGDGLSIPGCVKWGRSFCGTCFQPPPDVFSPIHP